MSVPGRTLPVHRPSGGRAVRPPHDSGFSEGEQLCLSVTPPGTREGSKRRGKSRGEGPGVWTPLTWLRAGHLPSVHADLDNVVMSSMGHLLTDGPGTVAQGGLLAQVASCSWARP